MKSVCVYVYLALTLAYSAVATCPLGRCTTVSGNIARHRNITSNSTCGDSYCSEEPCTPCRNPSTSHGIENINDDSLDTWWESDLDTANVVIQLDLEAAMIFESTVILWRSPRPMSMVLERSSDFGGTWIPYRYYSSSCGTTFGVTTYNRFALGMPPNQTEAICLAEDASISPMEGGEITFKITDQVAPGVLSDQELLEFQTVTNLRLRLVESFINSGVNYFAIYDWSVTGTCLCNGHGTCSPVSGPVIDGKIHAGCTCEHNTDGGHCEMCQPLYNNAPWMPANDTQENVCEMCMCFMHAESCVYSTAEGQGVCDCQDNTAGIMCESCRTGYYVNMTLMQTDPNVCQPCNCDPRGTVGGSSGCGADSGGQCSCKANVQGSLCDSCKNMFFNLTESNPDGCQACDCDQGGSVGCNDAGSCMCKDNVLPPDCSECVDGYFGSPSNCRQCGCNSAGSTNSTCDKLLGTCSCIPNVEGELCNTPSNGYYARALDSVRFEAEAANFVNDAAALYPGPDSGLMYTGGGLAALGSGGQLQFSISVEVSSVYEVVVRYSTLDNNASVSLRLESQSSVDTTLDCSTTSSTTTSLHLMASLPPSPSADTNSYSTLSSETCFTSGVLYSASLVYNGSGEISVDSIVLIPNVVNTSQVYSSLDSTLVERCIPRALSPIAVDCQEVTFTLSVEFYGQVFPCNCSEVGSPPMICNRYGGSCPCRTGVTGERCERCSNGYHSFTSNGCTECGCDPTGSTNQVCHESTGQCSCKPGVTGQMCDRCQSGFYNLTAAGCTPCMCSAFATSVECSDAGVCTCPPNVAGDKCDRCGSGFYNLTSSGCTLCGCDPSGSGSVDCNQLSGQCECMGGAEGRDCSECPSNFYRTTGAFTPVCEPCRCSGQSTACSVDEANYTVGAIQHDFTELCTQTGGDCADGWSLIDSSTNMSLPFINGGSRGLLYLAESDSIRLFAPSSYLGSRLLSYGLGFRAQVFVENLVMTAPFVLYLRGSRLNQYLVATMAVSVVNNDTYVLMAQFREDSWKIGSPNGSEARYTDLVTVLADLTELSFSARLETGEGVSGMYLELTELQQAVPTTATSTTMYPVEVCSCPANYTGQFCEECTTGYYRPSRHLGDSCIACNCNGLAPTCNVDTGVCVSCTGNSTGDNCEVCIVGYFGDPTRGIPCQPCPCPLVGRSFSNTCRLADDGLPTCDACLPGYSGRNCEICENGYFGDPMIGICNMCGCNGNVDPALGPVCNTTNGMCLNCQNNTTGPTCNECLDNYFGNPLNGDCKPCQCHVNGTRVCNLFNGQCSCKANVMGTLCDMCTPDHWGIHLGVEEGCLPCGCCANGSSSSQCDLTTGQCPCLDNVGSESDNKCCQCTPEYFGLTSSGCQPCGCSNGSVSNECDQTTGVCQCVEGATGPKCDGCGPEYEGRIPFCTRCHECFFSLNTTASDMTAQIAQEMDRVDRLSASYGNQSLSEVQQALAMLYSQLESIKSLLSMLVVTDADLQVSNTSLMQVQSSMASLVGRMLEISSFIERTEVRLNASYSVDLLSLQQLSITYLNQANNHNATSVENVRRANNAFATVQNLHASALASWQNATLTESQVLQASMSVQQAVQESMQVQATLAAFMSTYSRNRMDLATVDVTLNTTAALIESVISDLQNENVTLDTTFISVMNLTDIYFSRYMFVLNLLADVSDLEILVQNVTKSANQALLTAQQLLPQSQALVDTLQSEMSRVTNLTAIVSNASSLAMDARSKANTVLQLPIPDTDGARVLAQRINQSAVDEATVSAIFSRAESSRNLSESVLSFAQNASTHAERASNMVDFIDVTLSNVTDLHESINASLSAAEVGTSKLQDRIEEVTEAVKSIDDTYSEVVRARDNATELAQTANRLRNDSLMRSSELADNVTRLCGQVQQHQQAILSSSQSVQNVSAEVSRRREEAGQQQTQAQQEYARAADLNTAANEVSLARLQELLNEYISERNREFILLQRMAELNSEMDTLEDNIQAAASNLASCYRTP